MLTDDVNIDELMEQITSKKPDLVEFRIDRLNDRKLLEVIAKKKSSPIIATDRSNRDRTGRRKELAHAAGLGFDFVDLELTSAKPADVKQLKSEGAGVILSYHDNSLTPSEGELRKILEAERSLGGEICKLVTTAVQPRDNLTILGFVERESANVKLVSFAMGKEGVPSRVLSPLFGAEFTFAALSDKTRTADGQLTIDQLRSAWQILGLQ
jgi:3-dehydroquinate dehydratase type I